MYISYKRPAIAMIELIFSIVIMGIVLMSAPMLISTAASTTSVALQQEGINEASARVSMILTYNWDQNDNNVSCIPPVLYVTNGDDELNATVNQKRVGVPFYTNSRTFKCGSMEFNASTIGKEDSELDDMDDFSNISLADLNTSGSGGVDYIEQDSVAIATLVTYISDNANYNSLKVIYAPGGAAVGGTSNIKNIQVTVTSTSSVSELNKNIILNAFSCNIGGYEPEHREF